VIALGKASSARKQRKESPNENQNERKVREHPLGHVDSSEVDEKLGPGKSQKDNIDNRIKGAPPLRNLFAATFLFDHALR
jgi:hypothetical protein